MASSIGYAELPPLPAWRGGLLGGLMDVSPHLAGEFSQEGVYFGGLAFDDASDPPVRKIPDVAGYVEAAGDAAGDEAKPHSLHRTGIIDDLLDFLRLLHFLYFLHTWPVCHSVIVRFSGKNVDIGLAGIVG